MPKNKSHKGLLRRVRVTGTGKVKHRRRGSSHLNSGFTGDQRRHVHSDVIVAHNMARKLEGALHRRLNGPKQN